MSKGKYFEKELNAMEIRRRVFDWDLLLIDEYNVRCL